MAKKMIFDGWSFEYCVSDFLARHSSNSFWVVGTFPDRDANSVISGWEREFWCYQDCFSETEYDVDSLRRALPEIGTAIRPICESLSEEELDCDEGAQFWLQIYWRLGEDLPPKLILKY